MAETTQPEIAAFRKEIGARISAIRESRGLEPYQLADRMGVITKTVIGIEEGRFAMSIDQLRQLKQALGFEIVFEIQH